MRNFDFEPFFRSSIGFDRMFELLDRGVDVESEPAYPLYNIEKTGEDAYRLTVVVPGFKPTELSVVAEGMTLTVAGTKSVSENGGFLYRGFGQVREALDNLAGWLPIGVSLSRPLRVSYS